MSSIFEEIKRMSIEHGNFIREVGVSLTKIPAQRIEDLSDLEFEALGEKMYEDVGCMSAFVKENYDDFEQYMNERYINPDKYCDLEIDYCQCENERFIKFAFKYFNNK